MRGILHRRQIRIKVVQNFYALHCSDHASVEDAVRALLKSMDKSYQLYLLLLQSLLELKKVADSEMNRLANKRILSDADKNPNKRFVANKVLRVLGENAALELELDKHKVEWEVEEGNNVFVHIFSRLKDDPEYQAYLENDKHTWGQDMNFVHHVFKEHIVNQELIQEYLEEREAEWIDDLDLVALNVLKTLENFQISKASFNALMPLYKDKESDLLFAKTLLREASKNLDETRALVESFSKNWEWDRIAVMDKLLIRLGIAEAICFEQIPVKVTLNEYVEIAKEYSTRNSAVFVNGILDRTLKKLQHDEKIVKTGRGLIE